MFLALGIVLPTVTSGIPEVGFMIGFLYSRFSEKNWKTTLYSLLISMLSGRIVWGIVDFFLLGLLGKSLTFSMFLSAVFLSSLPGILLQLILIPLLMERLEKRNALQKG